MYYNLIMLFECTCSNIGTARLYKNATQSTFNIQMYFNQLRPYN
jgi:hypothetical protein